MVNIIATRHALKAGAPAPQFTKADCACYGDGGARGADGLNEHVIGMAESYGYKRPADVNPDFLGEVADSAVDFLNGLCEDGIHFEFCDGDFLLLADEDSDLLSADF